MYILNYNNGDDQQTSEDAVAAVAARASSNCSCAGNISSFTYVIFTDIRARLTSNKIRLFLKWKRRNGCGEEERCRMDAHAGRF